MNEDKITFNKQLFKKWIENIREEDRKYYKGDWDYVRYTKYEIREDGIWMIWHYYDNGVKPPLDGEKLLIPYCEDDKEDEE